MLVAPPASRLQSAGCVRAALCLLLLAAGCGPTPPPRPGVIHVQFTAGAVSLPELTISDGEMRLERIMVFGNVPPPMPPPPPKGALLDLLSPTGSEVVLGMLPRGVYSRVTFDFANVGVTGTWRGTPFDVNLGAFRGEMVDLRSAGKELGPGQDVAFSVEVDPAQWFAGDVLDGAVASNGRLLIDMMNNQTVTMQIGMRIPPSFTLAP
jgi:hypothetical protein